ncbi:PA2928 family protein [Streptomyces triticirhizae]|uniref:Uncharacterized protein n=1 Tax=Streptomyces triticirhizae TaxID=2483353 RepID=A0A3M2KZ52_9ACTN|nr:PA2928 family protein [Streptomyces triticirhizae]RMI27588.1 hypothetical protein EBN88_29155 [Streptomyces triticirhizae]
MRYRTDPGANGGRISSPYGTPDHPRWPEARRRRGLGAFVFLGVPLGITAVVLGGIVAQHQEPTITLQPGMGLAVTPARQLALVPYERSGEAGLLGAFTGDPWQTRLAAVDLNSGERAWDVRLSGELLWEATVLAAGDTHAYLTTDDGLMVVALADGSVAVRPDEVPGLGRDHIASPAAYGYDSVRDAVVTMDVQGDYHTIPVGELAASPADRETAAAWAGRLREGPLTHDEAAATAETASAGEAGSLALRPTEGGAPSATLVLTDPEGRERELGGGPLREPEILLAGGTRVATAEPVLVEVDTSLTVEEFSLEIEELLAGGLPDEVAARLQRQLDEALAGEAAGLPDLSALLGEYHGEVNDDEGAPRLLALGADRGRAVVREAADAVGDRYWITVFSLASGEVVDRHTVTAEAGHALTASSGVSVLPVASEESEFGRHDALLLLRPDGSLDEVPVGGTDLLGNLT